MNKNKGLLRQLASRLSDADRRFYRKADDVSARIIEVIKQEGLSQRELAERLCKPESYVSRVLGGGVNLTLKTIAAFEAALGADVLVTPVPRTNPHRRRSRFSSAPQFVRLASPRTISGVGVGDDGNLEFWTSAHLSVPARSHKRGAGAAEIRTTSAEHEELACAS